MKNFEVVIATALDKSNQTFIPKDIADMMYTTAVGVAMMKLQNAWVKVLQDDLTQLNDDYANYAGDSGSGQTLTKKVTEPMTHFFKV